MRKLIVTILFLFISVGCLFSQTDQELGLHSEGGPWKFYPMTEVNSTLPHVLLIGNSVMNGYHQNVIDSLKGRANVDYWLTPKHLNSEHLFTDLAKVVLFRDYDVIHFNIGLHGWPEGRIADEDYVPLLEKYVETIRENAEKSHLIWASITPVTEVDTPELNKDINPVIAHRNELAKGVMKKYGTYYFTNNLPYARAIEYGLYPKSVKRGTRNRKTGIYEIRKPHREMRQRS